MIFHPIKRGINKLNVSNFKDNILNKKEIVFNKIGIISVNNSVLEFESSKGVNYLKDA